MPKPERARQYSSGGGVVREDSDDELGLVDHPWEWIYKKRTNIETPTSRSTSRKRKLDHGEEVSEIVGARMGDFECRIGDTVLLKAEGNQAWVGLICDFSNDEEDEKLANFMWFSSQKEIRNRDKKRKDFLENELYITPSWDENPLASINGKANVISHQELLRMYPTGNIPKNSKGFGKTFVCRRGCNTRTATYTEEFVWEDIYKGAENIPSLIDLIQSQTKATRKRAGSTSIGGKPRKFDEDFVVRDTELEALEPATPKKRRKLETATTPTSVYSSRGRITPSHRRTMIKKALEFTPLGTRVLSPQHLSSRFHIARAQLHVSSVPTSLPCREEEFSMVYGHLEAAITDGSGSCIYISGTPGTGKTATVREVVAQLNAAVTAEELDDFIFVEINGMKVTDPHQSYSLLWEGLSGDRLSPAHALEMLEREFSSPSPRRVPCVVLMDELDQLVTKNQSVMYNFFNWPGLRHSRLIVLAVANTMDLPERTLSNKITSRLGLTRITFPGYTHHQLIQIIQSRLSSVPNTMIEADAIQFASRKVAAVSGDARRCLDICRRAVELAEADAAREPGPGEDTPTRRKEKHASSLDVMTPQKRIGKVTIQTIKTAIHESTSTPLAQHLRALPLAAKVFLAAFLTRLRRSGTGESVLGDVLDEARRLSFMSQNPDINEFLRGQTTIKDGSLSVESPRGETPRRGRISTKSTITTPRLHGVTRAASELAEAGIIGLESRRGDRVGRVRLAVGEEELRSALKEDSDCIGLGFT